MCCVTTAHYLPGLSRMVTMKYSTALDPNVAHPSLVCRPQAAATPPLGGEDSDDSNSFIATEDDDSDVPDISGD